MGNKFDFGLVGLGVMGRNYILNVAENGFSALGFDKRDDAVAALRKEAEGKMVEGTTELDSFVNQLVSPRKIMLLVPAGKPVDDVIESLLPILDKGDLIIDGGNSHFEDTNRREQFLRQKGILFMGTGVSGGSYGARTGPSIMPGGDRQAYELIRPIFEATAARVDGDSCVAWLGNTSAGNYVKMVHNGIEYGLMQLIAEAYQLLKEEMNLSNDNIASLFERWNKEELSSYLIEITARIFSTEDIINGGFLVDKIKDKAGQKGTGKWTSQNAMDLGIAIPSIDSAVTMRMLSAMKPIRQQGEDMYEFKSNSFHSADTPSVKDVMQTLYFSFMVTYAQGMTLLREASQAYDYDLNLETISKIWRGGCIIRASMLEDIRQAYKNDPNLETLLFDKSIAEKLKKHLFSVRKIVGFCVYKGVPSLSMTASLGYFDALTTGRLSTNLIQAQRDYFGSHTYERIDMPGVFHTNWI